MVPDKFDMVDMGGIDLIMMQGEEVPGLYNRLVESITQCRYQCLYNWLFDGVIIPPTYVEMEVNENDEVAINEGVVVTSDDVIRIYSIEPPAPEPEIVPLVAEENGVYNAPAGVDGFNPVTVDVPSYTPVIQSLSVTENGTYNVPAGTDGFAPVVVNVSGGIQNIAFHYGKLTINTGAIVEDSNYCYSDLIPITTGTGRWFLDIARSDVSSYNIGISFFDQEGTTSVGYIRQYEQYRSYASSGMDAAKYFRIAAKVSDLSFLNVAFLTDNIFIANNSANMYKAVIS